MTRDELRSFLLRRARYWAEKNLDAIMEDYDSGVDYITPMGRITSIEHLRENNERYLQDFTDISVNLTRLITDGEQGALEWTWSETRLADGSRRSVDDAIVFVIRDRKIVYWREYFDTGAFDNGSAREPSGDRSDG